MEINSIIYIEQTLHGYSSGHTLIASSVTLSPDSKRIMLPISDMSGSSMQAGFESYITGYPLKTEKKYAIAKTWYAPEMKRPGCVWTHTLLIDFSDLPKIKNLELLLEKFLRPNDKKKEITPYTLPIQYMINSEHTNYIYSVGSEILVKQILENIYQYPTSVLISKDLAKYGEELVVLSIWMQLWPRLRRNFSFCTGAISARYFQGELLDLQFISPKFDYALISRNKAIIINKKSSISHSDFPEWVALAFDNLSFPSIELERFLSFYGSDTPAKRTSFKVMVETYLYLKNNNPKLAESLKYLALKFKLPTNANNLKGSIFGLSNSVFPLVIPKYEEKQIILNLCSTLFYASYDYKKLMFKERFFNIFFEITDDSINFLKAVLESEPNCFGEEAVRELPSVIAKNGNLEQIWSDRFLSNLFVNLNPNLTYEKNFWFQQKGNEAEIVSILQNIDDTIDFNWKSVITNLIDIDADIDLQTFNGTDIRIEEFILEWIDSRSDFDAKTCNLGRNWLDYLKLNVLEVLLWLDKKSDININTMLFVVKILDPNSSEVINYGLSPWLKVVRAYDEYKYSRDFFEIHSFLLCVAFNSNNEKAKAIFEIAFEPVYLALTHDHLKYEYWKKLEPHTKSLSSLFNWDKSKKLAKALVELYTKNYWEISELAKCIHHNEISSRIKNLYYKKNK